LSKEHLNVVFGTVLREYLCVTQVEGNPGTSLRSSGTEFYRSASEALRNAFRQAGARHIEVEIHYDKGQFRLRVRDDGKAAISRFFTTAAARTPRPAGHARTGEACGVNWLSGVNSIPAPGSS